jgi:hypothetical protein
VQGAGEREKTRNKKESKKQETKGKMTGKKQCKKRGFWAIYGLDLGIQDVF